MSVDSASLSPAAMALLLLSALVAGGSLAPVRMSISTRANLLSLFALLLSFGLQLLPEPDGGISAGSRVCFGALAVLMALAVRFGVAWRLRANRRDWDKWWKYAVPDGPIKELFKRYHDID